MDLSLEEIDDWQRSGSLAARKSLDRLLQSRLGKLAESARRRVEAAGNGPSGKPVAEFEGALSRSVRRALRSRFRKAGLPASKRLVMPGGGRSFHFEKVSIRPDSCGLAKGHRLPGKNTVGKSKFAKDICHTARATDHQRYIVRARAIEDLASATSAQRYIDNPQKVDAGRHGGEPDAGFSFGTPGMSVEDMCEMWDFAERYPERKQNAVIQHRMIVELPHDATPADRIAIMRAFVEPIQRERIPFWVAIHAPTADNDERNYHAHVVFMNRPAKKIPWPEGGDLDRGNKPSIMTWDFACLTRKQDKHRKTRDRFLQRQNVPPLLRGVWVKKWRERFATIVNAQMKLSGRATRFDPRSYRDAGILDVTPERKSGYGRKIAERHEPELHDIIRALSEDAYREAEAKYGPDRRKLDRAGAAVTVGGKVYLDLLHELHVVDSADLPGRGARASSPASRRLAQSYFASEQASLDLLIAGDAERRVLQALVDATDANALSQARAQMAADMKSRTPDTRERSRAALSELPDDDTARDLRDSAILELKRVAAVRQREIEVANSNATAASAAWLNSLEQQDIIVPTEPKPTHMNEVAPIVMTKPAELPPVRSGSDGKSLPSAFDLPAPRVTMRAAPASVLPTSIATNPVAAAATGIDTGRAADQATRPSPTPMASQAPTPATSPLYRTKEERLAALHAEGRRARQLQKERALHDAPVRKPWSGGEEGDEQALDHGPRRGETPDAARRRDIERQRAGILKQQRGRRDNDFGR